MENAISSQRTNGFYAAIVKLQKILNNCEDFKNGKKGLIGLFMGEIMNLSKGKIDPKKTNILLNNKLHE